MKKFFDAGTKVDFYYHSEDYCRTIGDKYKLEYKIDDAVTRETAENYLSAGEGEKPLFMMLNFQKTHFPYAIPESASAPFGPCEWETEFGFFKYPAEKAPVVLNRFDNALLYVDLQVGGFLKFLKERGLYEDSLIIVAPDHGESFYDDGYPTHASAMCENQMRVFTLIKMPGGEPRGVREDPISLIDIPPTILEVLGLPNHPNFQGRQVLAKNDPARNIFMTSQGIVPSEGVVQYPWKFVKSEKEGDRLINFALDKTERIDFSGRNPEKRKELETALDNYIARQMNYYSKYCRSFYPPKYY
jgi:arylsulfatase A-like enzyme